MPEGNGLTFSNVSEIVMIREELYKVQEAVKALADKLHPILQAQFEAHNAAWDHAAVMEARQELEFAQARAEMRQHLDRTVGMMMSPRSWE